MDSDEDHERKKEDESRQFLKKKRLKMDPYREDEGMEEIDDDEDDTDDEV